MWLKMNCYQIGTRADFSKTISESDVYLFAGITGDMNPVHIDNLEAKKSFAGKRIVHGALISGLISGVIGMKLPGPGTIYMEQDAKYLKPVFIGDTVRATIEIVEILNEEKGIIKLDTKVFNQNNELVVDGFAVVKVTERTAGKSKISEKAFISKTAVIHEDVEIEEGVIIHDYVVIYPHTVIKKGTEIYDHCVLGKLPTSPGNTSRELKSTYAPLVIGENCVLCPGVVLYAGTQIGNNNLLGDFCAIREECCIGNNCIISRNVSVNYNTRIGNNTKIMDNSHITGNMVIGNNVFISVLVATTNDNTMGRTEYNEDHVKGATIGDRVTIGAAANILPGVNIGENVIVGASALVTKDIPDNKVVMGVPARIVRDVNETEKNAQGGVISSIYIVRPPIVLLKFGTVICNREVV